MFGMPGAAVARKAVDHLVHGDDIAGALVRLAQGETLTAEAIAGGSSAFPPGLQSLPRLRGAADGHGLE